MGKSIHNDVFDAALNIIKSNATRVTLCSAEPTTYAEGNATYALADLTIGSSDFTGPADGTSSGRKLTFNAQTGIDVDTTGTGTHIAYLDVSNSKLLAVTTCTSVAVDAAGTVDIGSHRTLEIADPS